MTSLAHSISYRAHIDGLRAIAVLAVILYHADIPGFFGGFIGVDVFFVISGFLITSIILRDVRAGTFSLVSFWDRRVRRIFPALAAMMIACIVAAYFFMLWPADFHNLGKAVVAQSVFASNVLFMVSDNYFDQPSRHSPLLHTWTLSVEEQFYVLFPIIIMGSLLLARRWGRVDMSVTARGEYLIRRIVIVLGFASFALSTWLVDLRPGSNMPLIQDLTPVSYLTAGFYLLPSRAWELAIGALVALLAMRTKSVLGSESLALAGALGVLAPIFIFNDATPFPGIAALLPTLGAAAIIAANEERGTFIGRILSSLPLVLIGVISYSLYLWHWPVLVFAKIFIPESFSAPVLTALISVIFLIAFLSYRYVETPFRTKRFMTTRGAVFTAGFGTMLVVGIVGLFIFRGDISNQNRMHPAAQTTLSILNSAESEEAFEDCSADSSDDAPQDSGVCRIGKRDGLFRPVFVLWGDSHAAALFPIIDALGKRYGVQGAAFTQSSCIPVSGVWSVSASDECRREQQEVLDYIEEHDVKIILLVAHWNLYVMGGRDQARSALITDSYAFPVSSSRAYDLFESHMTAMLESLAGQNRAVYIVQQVPEHPEFVAREAFYDSARTGQVISLQGVAASTSEAYLAHVNQVLMRAARMQGVQLIDPSHVFCDPIQRCAIRDGDTLLYRDDNHLSVAGASKLEPLFAPIFRSMRSGGAPGTNTSE